MADEITFKSTQTVVADGKTFTSVLTVDGQSKEAAYPSIPAAKIGALTTRTDANTGVLTMNAGHGFASLDKIDVFWDGGSRRAMDATVAVNAVTVDGGTGDDLPADESAITAMKPVEVAFVVDGDTVVGLAASSTKPGYVVFVDDADAEIAAAIFEVDLNLAASWATGNGVTNPLAGDITSVVKFSHGYSGGAITMRALAVFN